MFHRLVDEVTAGSNVRVTRFGDEVGYRRHHRCCFGCETRLVAVRPFACREVTADRIG